MADTADVRRNIRTIMMEHLDSEVTSLLAPRMVMLNFMCMKDGNKTGIRGLGRPKVANASNGVLVSGSKVARAKKVQIMGATVYQPIIQYKLPAHTDNKVITGFADNNPKRNDWENNLTEGRFVRPAFKWFILVTPAKISKLSMRMTRQAAPDDVRAWKAIGSLFEAESSSAMTVHAIALNERLIGIAPQDAKSLTPGRPSNESADFYDNLFGLEQTLHDSNSYGGVDRSDADNSWFRSNRITDSTSKSFEDLLIDAKLHVPKPLNNYGLGIDLMLVGNALFGKAIVEARAKGVQPIYNGSTPEFAEFGIKNDAVRIGRTWIVNEPSMPDGHVAGLALDTWTVAVHPAANGTVSNPKDQSENEGGDRAVTFNIETQLLTCCEWPAGNVYWTNVQA